MSYQNKIIGAYGDEKVTTLVKYHEFGTRMELPDGRIYAYARACTTPMYAGYFYEGPLYAGTADLEILDLLVPGNAAVGATTIVVTMGATTGINPNDYDEGYIYTASSAGAGVGEVYKIKTASTAAAGATTTIILYENDKLNTVIRTGTTTVGLRPNEFDTLHLVDNSNTRQGPPAGISPVLVAASCYCWIQRRGVATSYTAATIGIIGLPLTCNTAVDGEIGSWTAAASAGTASWADEDRVAYSLNPAGTAANFSLIYLTLD